VWAGNDKIQGGQKSVILGQNRKGDFKKSIPAKDHPRQGMPPSLRDVVAVRDYH